MTKMMMKKKLEKKRYLKIYSKNEDVKKDDE